MFIFVSESTKNRYLLLACKKMGLQCIPPDRDIVEFKRKNINMYFCNNKECVFIVTLLYNWMIIG